MIKKKHNKTNDTNIAATIAAAIIMIFALLLAPVTVRAQTQVSVSNFSQLQSAITAYRTRTTSDTVITVTADFSITASSEIPANSGGRTLTIRGNAANRTLTRGFYGDIFAVYSDSHLILENIVIDGNKKDFQDNNGSLVLVRGGTFTMNDGAILLNNDVSHNNDYGGGVYVESGIFTMTGGVITNNTSVGMGAVSVYKGQFTMTGGVISGNGGVYGGGVGVFGGQFTMTGGEISGNGGGYGGGVFVGVASEFDGRFPGTFTMTGGEISDNTSDSSAPSPSDFSSQRGGGGVNNSGTFTMTGGKISGNTSYCGAYAYCSSSSYSRGGGVYNSGTFTMTGGKISGNKSTNTISSPRSYGGGVYNSGIFTMTGGETTGNTAAYGGGVYYDGRAYCGVIGCSDIFNLGGTAVISGNTSGISTYNNVSFGIGSANFSGDGTGLYITLGTGSDGNGITAPEPGMSVGINKRGDDGFITKSGAWPGTETYFFVDEPGKKVIYDAGQLRIINVICIGETCVSDDPPVITITIPYNVTLTSPVVIPAGKTLIVRGANPNVTLTRGFYGNLFSVSGTLILEDIVIDGNKNNLLGLISNTSLVSVGGTFIMNDGTVLRNSTDSSHGGGVYVSGTFTMTGGEITGNTSYQGGGVYVDSGIFTMTGGKISKNSATSSGGGVAVYGDSSFTLGGSAAIIGNTAASGGGGVAVLRGSWMSGGGNVHEYVSTFTMTGGEITSNTAYQGGGVLVTDIFTMTGGKISGNTASSSGGGVDVYGNRSFTLGGEAVIIDNTKSSNASDNVYLGNDRFITLDATIPGMNISVQTATPSGLIVPGGCPVLWAFHADEPDKVVTCVGNDLAIASVLTDYLVTISSAGNGATGGGDYAPGTNVPISAGTPPPGMDFKSWTSSPIVIFADANSANTTFYMPANDVTVTVIFEQLSAPYVANFNELKDVISLFGSGNKDVTVSVDADLDFSTVLDIPANTNGKTLTITSTNPSNPITLTRNIAGCLFTVNGGASLTLENIIIDGNKDVYPDNTSSLVCVDTGGEFTMKDGAVLRNNCGAVLGGGVNVRGTFTMAGGEISGNTTSSAGGGVYVHGNGAYDNGGTFTMTGGEISGNTASIGGGVNIGSILYTGVDGSDEGKFFTMTDGKITGNTSSGQGGGVYVGVGIFTMTGGEISGNTSPSTSYGGGVHIASRGTFTMAGGEISGNTASSLYGGVGGGVNVAGTFTMTGGEISGNTASAGGGVYVTGTLTMTGGEISGNTASSGGGAYVSVGTFTLGGTALIIGNTSSGNAPDNVYLRNDKFITLDNAPSQGMNIGVRTETQSGLIVPGGCSAISAFHADEPGKVVSCMGSDLVIASVITDYIVTVPNGAIGGGYYAPGATVSICIGAVMPPPGAQFKNWTSSPAVTFADPNSSCTTFNMPENDVAVTAIFETKFVNDPFDELQTAISNYGISTQDIAVIVKEDFDITAGLNIPSNPYGVSLIIRSYDPYNPVILSRGFTDTLFTVNSGAKLIFENIIIAGDKDTFSSNSGPLVYVNPDGEFIMADGAVLRNNSSYNSVVWLGGGTFTMTGGEISGNATEWGVVYLGDNSTSKFTMNGGKISGNTVSNSGGGVTVGIGTFEMTGGEISDNTANNGHGSGVYISSGGEFTMTGGEISGNSASNSGGGVYVDSVHGTFTMTGGEISGNTATNGGGVFVNSLNGTFAMTGGEISGNTASIGGGGVYVCYGTFEMTGGEIVGNSAEWYGGGVYVYIDGEFTMTGGETTGNTSNNYGGGVYVASGTFTLGGSAVISGNSGSNNAPDNVYLRNDMFITLGNTPSLGMNIGVQTETPSGIIVNSGANASHAQYFFSDEPGTTVVYANGQLLIESVPTNYMVTVSSAGTGATGGGNYKPGDTVAVCAGTPPAGAQFINWTSSPAVTFANANSSCTTFTMPAIPVTVTANFESIPVTTYTVTISSAGTGATGGGNYEPDEIVSIYAGTAPAGRQFNNWTASPAVSFANANSANTTFKMPSNAVTVTANFVTTPPPVTYYAVTVSSAGTGATGGGNYVAGANVIISAGTPPAGQRFKNWTASPGVSFSNASNPNTTFTMPSNAVTVTANFEPDVQISEESIFITGMRPEFQIGLARWYYSTWVHEPFFPGNGDVEFTVAGEPGPFMLWIGLPDFPALMLDNIYPGTTIDVSVYFYDVAVPEGVSHAGISSFEDAVYGDFSEGDVITLLKTGDEWVLVFDRDGVYYEKTFVPDGSNPFPGEEPGVEPVVTVPSASVEKLSGGKERLTISLTETLSDGSNVTGTVAVTINENTAGYYTVGSYVIYVDALGSGSIRRCYIVNRD